MLEHIKCTKAEARYVLKSDRTISIISYLLLLQFCMTGEYMKQSH
jgi:hypothetical protein